MLWVRVLRVTAAITASGTRRCSADRTGFRMRQEVLRAFKCTQTALQLLAVVYG
jgi:hypothetical protein